MVTVTTPLTPLRQIGVAAGGRHHTVSLKLGSFNRHGSIKDRTAAALLASLDAAAMFSPDVEVVESTSGNLGIALAALRRARRAVPGRGRPAHPEPHHHAAVRTGRLRGPSGRTGRVGRLPDESARPRSQPAVGEGYPPRLAGPVRQPHGG